MFKKVSLMAILILGFSCNSKVKKKEVKVKELQKIATLEYEVKAS